MIVDKKIVSLEMHNIDTLKSNFGHFWPKLVHLTNKFVKKSSCLQKILKRGRKGAKPTGDAHCGKVNSECIMYRMNTSRSEEHGDGSSGNIRDLLVEDYHRLGIPFTIIMINDNNIHVQLTFRRSIYDVITVIYLSLCSSKSVVYSSCVGG